MHVIEILKILHLNYLVCFVIGLAIDGGYDSVLGKEKAVFANKNF